jgi:hypothetical protein
VESGDAPAKRSWVQWLRDVVPNWVQAVAAVLVLFGVTFGGSRAFRTPGKTVTQTVTAGQGKAPAAPATAVYLSDLQPTAGDTPTRGDSQIGDQDFRHSIFYDNIPSNQSSASSCKNVAEPTCQASDYSIASGRYHQFSAMLGVTGCSSDMAQWSLSVDSVVVRSGTVAVNSSPQRISVAIPRGNNLELLVSTSSFSGAACGGVSIIWGNAQLSAN